MTTELLIPRDRRLTFSELLRYVIAIEPTTEAELARRIGVSRQRINLYIHATRIAPPSEQVPNFAAGLRVSVAVIREAIYLSQTRAAENRLRRAQIRAYRRAFEPAKENA